MKNVKPDIRNLIENERNLSGGSGLAPGYSSEHPSFAPQLDPNSDSGIDNMEIRDPKSRMKSRLNLLQKILTKLLNDDNKDNNELNVPQVGQRGNYYAGVPDSSLNPPSGADGSTPGSNMSAAPVDGGISQL